MHLQVLHSFLLLPAGSVAFHRDGVLLSCLMCEATRETLRSVTKKSDFRSHHIEERHTKQTETMPMNTKRQLAAGMKCWR